MLLLARLLLPSDATLAETTDTVSVSFASDTTVVAFHASCVQTQWDVEGITTVFLNGRPVSGHGSQFVCGESPWLRVLFENGSARDYLLARYVVFTAEVKLLATAAFVLLGAFLFSKRPVGMRTQPIRYRWLGYLRDNATNLASPVVRVLLSEPRWSLLTLILVFITGLAIRLFYLTRPLSVDEAQTIMKYASSSLGFGLSVYDEPNNHIFHTLLVHLSMAYFGNNDLWVVRLPTLVAGLLTIPATFMVARTLFCRTTAVFSTALVTFLYPLIEYSTKARGYSIIVLFTVLLLGLAVYVQRHSNRAAWLVYTVISALGFYTIPIFLYPFTVVSAWLLGSILLTPQIMPRPVLLKRLLFSVSFAVILAGALYLPVLARSGIDALVGNTFVAPLPWADLWSRLLDIPARIWEFATETMPKVVQVVLGVAFAVGVLLYPRVANYGVNFGLVVVIVMIPLLVLQRVEPFARVFIFLIPLAAMLASSALANALKWLVRSENWRVGAIIGTAVLVCVLNIRHSLLNPDLLTSSVGDNEAAYRFIEQQIRPNVAMWSSSLLTTQRRQLFEYYLSEQDYPSGILLSSPENAQSLYLFVERQAEYLEDVMLAHGLELSAYSQPTRLKNYQFFDLYLVQRQ